MSHGPAPEAGRGQGAGSRDRAAPGPFVWILVLGVAAVAALALFGGSSTPPAVGRGSEAPPFALPSLSNGQLVDLSALRGKVVLVNFWATWCKPCEDEMPAMERLHRALADEDFELLAVAVDEDPAVVSEFASRHGLTFPILLDPDQQVARAYQTFRFPETLLVGRDGVIVERYVGPKEWDAAPYQARLRRLLDGGATSG